MVCGTCVLSLTESHFSASISSSLPNTTRSVKGLKILSHLQDAAISWRLAEDMIPWARDKGILYLVHGQHKLWCSCQFSFAHKSRRGNAQWHSLMFFTHWFCVAAKEIPVFSKRLQTIPPNLCSCRDIIFFYWTEKNPSLSSRRRRYLCLATVFPKQTKLNR